MSKSIYAASILRYIHDQVTGEFVNVGVVLFCGDRFFAEGRILSKTQRITQFFPVVQGRTIRRSLKAIRDRLSAAARVVRAEASLTQPTSAEANSDFVIRFAHEVVVEDDSALQWSKPFTGLTSEPASTLNHLFDRLVRKYESEYAYQKRSDAQVWNVFSRELQARNLSSRIEEHEISARLETVKFKHALKNGRWHLLEPVSFDLMTAESIKDKAKRILGQMTVLKDSNADFQLHFLVGEPRSDEMREAYETALKILAKVPVPSDIFTESMRASFADEITRISELPH
ncbi:MAG: hypothetical protein ABT16_01285 [Rhodanobacter sp. SCN 65-17]|nr:MAG: hypothetical protein ABT16_01285 [Rhodanobacter sp. SCN 65-17]